MNEASHNTLATTASRLPRRDIGCGFWLSWLLATVLGGGIGWVAGWWISFRVPGALGTPSLGLTCGVVLGVVQWLVLRGILPNVGWWIAASALGWGVGFAGGAALAGRLNLVELEFSLALGAAVGLCTGIAQWLVLQRSCSYAGWWVPVNIFSWTSAFIYYQGGLSLRGLFFGLLVGILSGWALMGILNFGGTRQSLDWSQ